MTLDALVALLAAVVLLLGLALATIGLYGMLRRPDIFEQLHAAGLVTGPGVILVLLASLATGRAEIVTSAVLVIAFVLITGSLSTHVIALAAWRQREVVAPLRNPRQGTVGESERMAGVSTVSPARVLIAHDGSRGADVAIRLARSVAWSDGTRIRIVTAIEGDLPPLTGDPRAAEPTVDPAEAPGAAAELLRRDGVAVDSVVRRGQPAAAIIGEAEAFDANLIVVGSRGFGQVRALLMGSVAASVVDGARCPVLVARVPTIRTVLLATDGSESSTAATHAVARWPIFERASIHVLTVATGLPQYGDPSPVGGMPGAAETARQQRVADLAVATLRAAGRDALPNVRAGDAITRIVGFAESRSVDLIVIGSRGNTGLKRALAGSVARGVLMAARTSVLIVRVYPSGD